MFTGWQAAATGSNAARREGLGVLSVEPTRALRAE